MLPPSQLRMAIFLVLLSPPPSHTFTWRPAEDVASSHKRFPLTKPPFKKDMFNLPCEKEGVLYDPLLLGKSTVEQILMVEEKVCGNVCGADFPHSRPRWNNLTACQACQCDATCVVYNNCCPDVYLLKNVSYSDQGTECALMSPTEYDVSATTAWITDYNKERSSSIITKCPPGANIADHDKPDVRSLRRKCEEPNVSELDEALPVSDKLTNLTYRNMYCASCNNVDKSSYHRWNIEVSCKNPDKLFETVPTKDEVYRKLITESGVKNSDCQMTYVSGDPNTYRRPCRKPTEKLVSKCYELDNSYHYNRQLDLACRTYTSPFVTDRTFKNIFCYLCNWGFDLDTLNDLIEDAKDLGTQEIMVNNPSRLRFATVVDFSTIKDDEDDDDDDDDDGDDDDNESNANSQQSDCSSKQAFDNVECLCRNIHCQEWRSYDASTRKCTGGLGALGVGYKACFMVEVGFDAALTVDNIHDLIEEIEDSLVPIHQSEMTVAKWCPGESTITFHLESFAIQRAEDSYDFEDAFGSDCKGFCSVIMRLHLQSNALGNLTSKSCKFDTSDELLCQASSTVNRSPCLTSGVPRFRRVSVVNGTATPANPDFVPLIWTWEEQLEQLIFHQYRRLDHCPFIEFAATGLDETDHALVHAVSLRSIEKVNIEFMRNKTIVRMCHDDYIKWSKTDSPRCGD